MKIYRLYYLEQECIPSDYVDEDGYIDDYYDNYIDHDITLGYFANKVFILCGTNTQVFGLYILFC